MIAWLLDTCVVIDYLRDRPEAVEFIRRASDRPAVSAITAAELFAGARTTSEERRVEGLLAQLRVTRLTWKSRGAAVPTGAATGRVTASSFQMP